MKRRNFLQSSIAACIGAAALAENAHAADKATGRDVYELRAYSLKVAKKPMLDDYLSKALVPALRRLGAGPVGVFSDAPNGEEITVWVLLVLPNAELAVALPDKLAADAEYMKAGADFLNAPAADPVYERIESSLMVAFEAMPHLAKPDTSKPRIVNLRTYESHNERAAKKKIEMFNTHEMPIFQRVGLTPVLFGETLVGPRMPNLTYMLVFPDDGARKGAWDRFRTDTDWLKLKAMPEYADKEIVSKITNRILTPEPYSEI